MIVPPTGVRVLVATKPVDFRKGMDGLAAYVQEQMQADPFSGVVYVFRAKRSDKVKLLFWDGTGVCLVIKRLEGAKFRWPAIQAGDRRITPSWIAGPALRASRGARLGARPHASRARATGDALRGMIPGAS